MSERTAITFIAITGNPTKEKLITMMEGYKKNGINDVMIYPRTGLEADYMSDDWLDLVGIFVDYAKNNDMRVWLYDELNWPSGTCNGQVYYSNIDNYNKCFYVEDGEVHVYQYCFNWENIKGFPFYGCKNDLKKFYEANEDNYIRREFDAKTGKLLNVKKYKEDYYDIANGNGNPMCGGGLDLLNPETTRCFLKLTHQRYYDRFKEDFGTIIRGIFTDEPSPYHFINPTAPRSTYCYYVGIIDDYKAKFGTDMIEDMLAYEYKQPDNNFMANYLYLVGRRFKKAFLQEIYDWCEEHGIEYTGHMVKDDSSTDSVKFSGEMLDTLQAYHIPGVDEIYTRMTYNESFLGLPASSGTTSDFLYSQLENMRRNGKKSCMSELYALGPYNMSVAQRVRALYYAAAFGVNHFFIGMGHMDGKGNFLRSEYFNNACYTCFDADNLKFVAEGAKKALPFAEKITASQVSVRYPYTSTLHNFGRVDTVDYEFLLKDVLGLIGKNQYQWVLIGDQEKSKTKVTVAFGKNGIINEETGKVYNTAEAWFNDVKESLSRNIEVTEMSGELADDVFVREFTDGTFMVINRADDPGTARRVVVNVLGKKQIINLLDYGVYTGEQELKVNTAQELIPENISVDMKGGKRWVRCNFFGNHSYSFETDCDLFVTMHICSYPEKRDVFLDGDILEYSKKETKLTDCYNPLYTVSEPILLKRGKHVLSIHEFDRNFLPMIIFEGNIKKYTELDDDGVKYDVITTVPEIPSANANTEFLGTASVNFTLDVPQKGANIVLDDFLGMCEVFVNGESIGKNALAPYVFNIGEKFGGKNVKVEILYYSSYGAMFGDIIEYEKIIRTRADWVRLSPPSSRHETVGMNGLRIFAVK